MKILSYFLGWFLMGSTINALSNEIAASSINHPSPFILILRGPPASGKTSVSLVLRDKLAPAARIDIDVLRYLVTPRDFSIELLRAIKLNAARIAASFAEQGISSIIESAFVSKEIIDEMCSIIHSYGFTPIIFTLVIDEETVLKQNLQRELYYQTDQTRLHQLYQNYHWDIGQKIYVKNKEIEEVAADISMHLKAISQITNPVQPNEEGDQFVLFLRHGQAPNHPHIFLSDQEKKLSSLGEYQAMSIASTINLFNPDSVFCSPYLRTVMTAQLACKGKEVHLRQDLAERSFPMLYGKTRGEISLEFSSELADQLDLCSDQIKILGSETLSDAQQRVVQEMQSILTCKGKKKLIVSHGGPHSWLCCHYLGLDISCARNFFLSEGHISLFQFDCNGVFKRIVCMNAMKFPPLEKLTKRRSSTME